MFEYSGMKFSLKKGDWVLYSLQQSKKKNTEIIIRKSFPKEEIIYMYFINIYL